LRDCRRGQQSRPDRYGRLAQQLIAQGGRQIDPDPGFYCQIGVGFRWATTMAKPLAEAEFPPGFPIAQKLALIEYGPTAQ
jgi:hypothetical protein